METVIICFLCGKDTVKKNLEIYDIHSTYVTASQTPLHVVFQHLANCIKYQLVFKNESYICGDCYKEICSYEELMLNLLSSQRRLTTLLQNALTEKSVKSENSVADVNDQSTDIEIEDEPSLDDAFNPNLDIKEELVVIDDDGVIIEEEAVEETADSQILLVSLNDNDSKKDETIKPGRKRRSLECVLCGEVKKSKILLQNHMSEVHNIKQFTCKICGVTRKDEEYLELHMNIHKGKTEYECRYCPKRFSRPVNTLRHMRIHWDKKNFQCEKCGERFSVDHMLHSHRLKHEVEENPLICGICNHSYKSLKTYTHHLLIHQENRPRYHCHLCPKSFTEKCTLKMHLKTHWGEKHKSEANASAENSECCAAEKKLESDETIGI